MSRSAILTCSGQLPRLRLIFRRARSIKMRRIAWAAAPKKCARFCPDAGVAIKQPQPSFVNQGCGLQRLSRRLPSHMRTAASCRKFMVNQRKQFFGGTAPLLN